MIVLTRRGYVAKEGSRFGEVLGALQSGIRSFRSTRTLLIALAVAPLPWLWEAMVITFASHPFGIHITMTQAFCVLIGFNLAMVVPSPGGIGSVEVGGTAALVFFGVDQAKAIAFMFIYHFAQLLPGIVTGAAILVAEGEHLFGGPASEPEAESAKT